MPNCILVMVKYPTSAAVAIINAIITVVDRVDPLQPTKYWGVKTTGRQDRLLFDRNITVNSLLVLITFVVINYF